MIETEKLRAAIWEADRHLQALDTAREDWNRLYPPPATIEELERDSELVRLTDQILFRFTKLQDAMGQRLVPATLAALREPYEDWPMLDRLDKLEKLGFLNAQSWLEWREIRNRLAHEYPGDSALRFANLHAAIQAAEEIAANYRRWREQLRQRNLI